MNFSENTEGKKTNFERANKQTPKTRTKPKSMVGNTHTRKDQGKCMFKSMLIGVSNGWGNRVCPECIKNWLYVFKGEFEFCLWCLDDHELSKWASGTCQGGLTVQELNNYSHFCFFTEIAISKYQVWELLKNY